ncbi:MAG: extracellular solute-binding protein [Ignavibacteriales bacterium]|nr:extracellular solute-binding protein [Ignavibacteriales bacterium]
MSSNRSMAFLLFAALIVSSCGTKEQSRTGMARITYNCAANAVEIKHLQEELPSFADSTGVELMLQPFTGQEKLYAMIAAGQPPDIFYTNNVLRDRLAAEGRLLDMRSLSAGDPFADRLWPDVYRQGFSADSGLYSIGNWNFTAGVYYNKDLFDKAGLQYPDTSWTWNDLLAAARRIAAEKNAGGEPEHYGVFIPSHFVEIFELMNGASTRERSLFLNLSEASLEVYRHYLALMNDRLMPDLRRMQAMGMQASQLLQTGKVAMLVEAVPHQVLFETLTIRWGVAPIPRFGIRPVRCFRSESGGLSISSQTENPQAAWKALKWIIGGASIYQPNPVLRDVDFVSGWEARYPRLVGSGFREVWQRSLKYPAGDPRFFVRFSSWTSASILERLQPLLDKLWARETTVEALAASQSEINRAARTELDRLLQHGGLGKEFITAINQQLLQAAREPQR